MHLKRQATSKSWPIPRKGTKYLVVPSHSKDKGVPLLILLRDSIGMVSRRRELSKIIYEKKLNVNGKAVGQDNLSLTLFDVIEVKPTNKFYRVVFNNKKLGLEEISAKDAESKTTKVINKKILKGKKVQINLIDGTNIISSEKVNTGESIKFNFKTRKIEEVIPIKEKTKVVVIKGSHIGNHGIITKIEGKRVFVKTSEKEIEAKEGEVIALK